MRRIECESCPVRGHGVVCDLPLETLSDLRAAGSSTVYRSRQVIFAEGQPAPGLFIVCSGAVKLSHSDRFGREHVVDVVRPGAVVGEVGLEPAQLLSVTAEAVTDSQLAFISNAALPAFLRQHPEAGVRLLAALSQALSHTQRKVRELALKSAESRLATLLLELAGDEARQMGLRYKRRELAEMVGVSTETVIRLLAKLKAKGVIDIDGHDVAFTDPERLRRIAYRDDPAWTNRAT